jgi:hypothetical protein
VIVTVAVDVAATVPLAVAVGVDATEPVAVAVGLGADGHAVIAAETAVSSSSIVTVPSPLRSNCGHASRLCWSSAMFTPRTNSSMVTWKSPLQSPAHDCGAARAGCAISPMASAADRARLETMRETIVMNERSSMNLRPGRLLPIRT